MMDVEDCEPLDDLAVVHRRKPGHNSTPVMTSQEGSLATALDDQIADIPRQEINVVGRHARGLRGEVVAAHIWCDDPKASLGKGGDLVAPAVPELRKAMQQDDQGSLTCFDVMQSHLVKVGIALPHIPGLNLSHVQPSIADSQTTFLARCASRAPVVSVAQRLRP
jgi:hypothetical protein